MCSTVIYPLETYVRLSCVVCSYRLLMCHTVTPVHMWLALLKHAAIPALEGVGWLIPHMARAAVCMTCLYSVPLTAPWRTVGSGQSRMSRLWWCSGSSSSSGSSLWRGSCDSCVNSTSVSLVIRTAFNRPEQSSDWLIELNLFVVTDCHQIKKFVT
jgi:hypothetical protein